MTYADLLHVLFQGEWRRIERDDRLLDVFPIEDREKGVELWERWNQIDVEIVRVRLPFDDQKLQLYRLPRFEIEQLLLANTSATLAEQPLVALGEGVKDIL